MKLDIYEQTLLDGWETTHKQSQLTLWIMLALKDGPKHMSEIKVFISDYTNSTIKADDKSMYRALRRFHDAEIVDFVSKPSKKGPERKIYSLSEIGNRILESFIDRNIDKILYETKVKQLILGK